jgi:hypothetical protein
LQAVIDAGRKHRLTVTSIRRSNAEFDLVFQGEGDALALAAAARAVWQATERGLQSATRISHLLSFTIWGDK